MYTVEPSNLYQTYRNNDENHRVNNSVMLDKLTLLGFVLLLGGTRLWFILQCLTIASLFFSVLKRVGSFFAVKSTCTFFLNTQYSIIGLAY